MYELMQAAGDSYYIESPSKIGVVRINGDEVIFIDSGSDKDAGKRALRAITEKGWTLNSIYNTHSHADHIGGNGYLQKQTGCSIYAPGVEHAFVNYTMLEPVGLYGGNPISDLRNKFTMAQPSETGILTSDVLPEGVSILALPGHSLEQAGFKTKDGAAYVADSIASRETIEKYGITFLHDVGKYLDTLKSLKHLDANVFIPAHAPVTDDITELVDVNLKSVHETEEIIWTLCSKPICMDELLKKIFDRFNLKMSVLQYALIGNTARSYLTWLKESGRVEIIIKDNRLFWKSL